jgi:hypothetical protein
VTAYGFDLVRGTKTLDLVKSAGFPSGKYLFAGVVDGRNIWADDLAASLSTLQSLESVVGKGKHRTIHLLFATYGSQVRLFSISTVFTLTITYYENMLLRTKQSTYYKVYLTLNLAISMSCRC